MLRAVLERRVPVVAPLGSSLRKDCASPFSNGSDFDNHLAYGLCISCIDHIWPPSMPQILLPNLRRILKMQ